MVLLELLAEQEDYGYSVVVRLQGHGFSSLREGSVYPALTRLEHNGLLGSRLVRSDAGPARKYYRVTAAGRDELARSVDAWTSLVGTVDRILSLSTLPRSAS